MSDINNIDPVLFTAFRKGTSDDPYKHISEEQQINNGMVRLSEIPQKQYRVKVTSSDNSLWYEIEDGIPSDNQYRVDYNNGIIYFNIKKNEARTLRFDFLGIGQMFVNASRVYDAVKDDGSIQETLQQLIDANRVYGNLAHRREPVNTFSDLASTYPIPVKGDMVQVLDSNKMYIYTGHNWYWFLTFPFQQVMKNKEDIRTLFNDLNETNDHLAQIDQTISDHYNEYNQNKSNVDLQFINVQHDIQTVADNKYRMTFNRNQLGVNIQNPMDLSVLENKYSKMREIGIHNIILCPQANMQTAQSNDLIEDTISYDEIKKYAQSILSAGFNVILKLHVETKDGTWRGQINPSNLSTFFNNYKSFIVKYARLAEELNMRIFCIGEEMVSLTKNENIPSWYSIISEIRSVYHGKITYGANMLSQDDEYKTNCLNPLIDILGVSLWAKQCDPSGDQLNHYKTLNTWIIGALEDLSKTYNKKIIITELGYFPTPEGASWANSPSAQNWAALDYRFMESYYYIGFTNIIGQPWFYDVWYWCENNKSYNLFAGSPDRYSVLVDTNVPTQSVFKMFKEETLYDHP